MASKIFTPEDDAYLLEHWPAYDSKPREAQQARKEVFERFSHVNKSTVYFRLNSLRAMPAPKAVASMPKQETTTNIDARVEALESALLKVVTMIRSLNDHVNDLQQELEKARAADPLAELRARLGRS